MISDHVGLSCPSRSSFSSLQCSSCKSTFHEKHIPQCPHYRGGLFHDHDSPVNSVLTLLMVLHRAPLTVLSQNSMPFTFTGL